MVHMLKRNNFRIFKSAWIEVAGNRYLENCGACNPSTTATSFII